MDNNVLIIYHANCNDGYTAAASAAYYYDAKGINCFVVGMHYPKDRFAPSTVRINDTNVPVEAYIANHGFSKVVMVDFSVNPQQMFKIWLATNSLLVLDHHGAWTKPEMFKGCLPEAGSESKVSLASRNDFMDFVNSSECILDDDLSGAGLVAKHLLKRYVPVSANDAEQVDSMRKVIKLVSDRDNWKRDNKDAIAYHEAVFPRINAIDCDQNIPQSLPRFATGIWSYAEAIDEASHPVEATFYVIISDRIFNESIERGYAYIDYRDSLIESIASQARFYKAGSFAPVNFIALNCPKELASECGEYLRDKYSNICQLFIMHTMSANGKSVSISARSTVNFSAKEWAESHNGGGHPRSAGCSISMKDWQDAFVGVDYETPATIEFKIQDFRESSPFLSKMMNGVRLKK